MKSKAAFKLQQSCGCARLVAVRVEESAHVALLKAHRPPGTPGDKLECEASKPPLTKPPFFDSVYKYCLTWLLSCTKMAFSSACSDVSLSLKQYMVMRAKREEESTAVEKTMRPLNRLNIHSAFWILASIAVTYYFDFLKNIKETMQTDSWWLSCGTCLLAACLSVAFYCILYLEWYCGIQDYDEQYPALIPITTATFIAAAICFNVALWPVWSFLTPVLLFIQFMGVVMLVSLLG